MHEDTQHIFTTTTIYHFDNTGNLPTLLDDVHECDGSTKSVVRAQCEPLQSDVLQVDEEPDSEPQLSLMSTSQYSGSLPSDEVESSSLQTESNEGLYIIFIYSLQIYIYVSGSDKRVHLVNMFPLEVLEYRTPFTRYGPFHGRPCLRYNLRMTRFLFIPLHSVYS